MQKSEPVVLVILDGWGISPETEGNAIGLANTPNFDRMEEEFPTTTLEASGEAVGLPEGQMGNSEVGHLNIGAGRVVYQEFTRISKSIRDGSFFKNKDLLGAVKAAARDDKALHLMGLLSDGGVHSHIDHLFALLEMAKKNGAKRVYVHTFLDGRDVAPDCAMDYIKQLESKMAELNCGEIATVMGRYYAMDRDKRWERVEKAYRAMVAGEGEMAATAGAAVHQSYERREMDEFVLPSVIVDARGEPVGQVQPGDSIIFFNFRADRAREITRAFVEEDFDAFERPNGFLHPHYVCMTQYDKEIDAPVAFPPQNLVNTLGEVLARYDRKQIRIAETEKYAHVTFFFNGGVEEPNQGEDRVLVPSPKVATYNLQPEMSAFQVAEKVLEAVASDKYDVLIVNFANPDMVGHTGILEAAVQAIEAVDTCLGRIEKAVLKSGGTLLVTADHGNAEQMFDLDGGPHTAHTTDLVPLILINERLKNRRLKKDGSLQDIAPTMLSLLGIPKPVEMTGQTLIG